MSFFDHYRKTQTETIERQRSRVDAAVQTYLRWAIILKHFSVYWGLRQAVGAPRPHTGAHLASLAETSHFIKTGAGYANSIYLATSGVYRGAIFELRNCLELTVDSLMDLYHRPRLFFDGEGNRAWRKFSQKIGDLRERDILPSRDEDRDSYGQLHNTLSEIVHAWDIDTQQAWISLPTEDDTQGRSEIGSRLTREAPIESMKDLISDEPLTLNWSAMSFPGADFDEEMFTKWFDFFWITYKACFALVSKFLMPFWLENLRQSAGPDPEYWMGPPNKHLINQLLTHRSRLTGMQAREMVHRVSLDLVKGPSTIDLTSEEDPIPSPNGILMDWHETILSSGDAEPTPGQGRGRSGNIYDPFTGVNNVVGIPSLPSSDLINNREWILRLRIADSSPCDII